MSERAGTGAGDRLAAIRERERKATKGPWAIPDDDLNGRILRIGPICGYDYDALELEHDDPDAEFVSHAREDVPWLLAEVDRLRAALEQAELERDALREVAVCVADCDLACPTCRHCARITLRGLAGGADRAG